MIYELQQATIIPLWRGQGEDRLRQEANLHHPAASAAQLGVEKPSPYRNSVGVQPATGLIGVCGVSYPALRLLREPQQPTLTRGYPYSPPAEAIEF
jgi:hypothetical protein